VYVVDCVLPSFIIFNLLPTKQKLAEYNQA